MKLIDLKSFLTQAMPASQFKLLISSEVSSYRANCIKTGASAPIRIDGQGPSICVDARALDQLCRTCLDGVFDEWHVQYLCNALLLYPNTRFDGAAIEEQIEDLSESSDEPWTQKVIRICRSQAKT